MSLYRRSLSATWSSLKGNYSGLANSGENGRNNPNGERTYDLWQFQWDKNLNPIDGPLATDRPLMFKFYGSYVFPKGLTVGTVMQAMSGTPLPTAWNVDGPGYYPFNRGDLGRTPFLFYADAYAEYNWRFGGRYGLQFSVNQSNVFNVETATNFNQTPYRVNISPGDEGRRHFPLIRRNEREEIFDVLFLEGIRPDFGPVGLDVFIAAVDCHVSRLANFSAPVGVLIDVDRGRGPIEKVNPSPVCVPGLAGVLSLVGVHDIVKPFLKELPRIGIPCRPKEVLELFFPSLGKRPVDGPLEILHDEVMLGIPAVLCRHQVGTTGGQKDKGQQDERCRLKGLPGD